MSDGDEDAFDFDRLVGFALCGGKFEAGDTLAVTEHLLHRTVQFERDAACLYGFHQVVHHDGLCSEGVAAVHERDVTCYVGEVERFFDCGVAAAHHGDRLAAVEEAVAGGAARDALALVQFFAVKSQVHCRGARRDDERVAGVFSAHVSLQREGARRKIHRGDHVEGDGGAEAFGLLLKPLHEFGSLNAINGGRPVVDLGSRHELSAVIHARDERGFEIGSGGVDGGSEAGGAGTENDELAVFGFHAKNSGGAAHLRRG